LNPSKNVHALSVPNVFSLTPTLSRWGIVTNGGWSKNASNHGSFLKLVLPAIT